MGEKKHINFINPSLRVFRKLRPEEDTSANYPIPRQRGEVPGRKHANNCSHPPAPAALAADWITFPGGRLQGL